MVNSKQKKGSDKGSFLDKRSLAVSYFNMGTPILSSALSSFTSEFEMGSGGTYSLLPPSNSLSVDQKKRHSPWHP
jgi:hypothetical protein